MGIVLLLASLALLMFFCFKGVPIFIAAFLSGLFLLLTSGLNPVDSMVSAYATGLGGYFGQFFFIFVLGAIFGKLTEISGAADAIAHAIIKKCGENAVIPAIMVTCGVLAYGGVSVFVALFTVYPMMVSMFRKANISRTLLPAAYFAGAGTAACWLPGSPQIQNLIPGQFLGTPATAALVPGIIAGVLQMIMVFAYMIWATKRSRAKGQVYLSTEADQQLMDGSADKRRPPVLLALLPMVALLVALNVFQLKVELALFVGVVASLVFYLQYLPWANIWKELGAGTMSGTNALFNTAAVVGFGALVKLTPAFQGAIEGLTSLGGNPLIAAGIAVTGLAGICGSGSGGLGIAMPILSEYFLPLGVNAEALHRVSALASLGLDSLPHNGLVVTALNVCGVSHKEGYGHVFVVICVTPLIALAILIGLFAIIPGWM